MGCTNVKNELKNDPNYYNMLKIDWNILAIRIIESIRN